MRERAVRGRRGIRDGRPGSMVGLRGAAVAALLAAVACGGASRFEGDAGTRDGRDGTTDDAAARDEAASDEAAVTDDGRDGDADVDPCGPTRCPNDPAPGPVGEPCLDGRDCRLGLTCLSETAQSIDGEEYLAWAGGYCAVLGWDDNVCDPRDPDDCPTGSLCVPFGATRWGRRVSACFDDCAVASTAGVPWANNCDCREGYACSLVASMCLPGCVNDRECCEIWQDRNENGNRDVGEVTRLGPDRCLDDCDPCRFECRRAGCPGGGCRIGDPCTHDADCPPLGRCIDEWSTEEMFPGGLCTRDRCDLVGRACPLGSGCGNLGGMFFGYRVCLVPCPAGADPGAPGNPCRDADPPGPSAGDYACRPARDRFWMDETIASGFCWAGNFAGGDGAIGDLCVEDEDCRSPHGLGTCARFPLLAPFCSVDCNAELAAGGICQRDPGSAAVTGVCFAGTCVASCPSPEAPRGENGCPGPLTACYLSSASAILLAGRAGAELPPGFCLPACPGDEACRDLWGDARPVCDLRSGVCRSE